MADQPKPAVLRSPLLLFLYGSACLALFIVLFGTISLLLESRDPNSLPFFISLPTQLQHHYARGTLIKVETSRTLSPLEVFAFQSENSADGSEKVVILHGLGLNSFGFREVVESLGAKGIHAVSFDLPGHGFSNKTMEVVEEGYERGFYGRMWDVYYFIKENGLFWAFDRVVETGQLPYDEILAHFNKGRTVVKPASLRSDEVGMALGQVIETLGLGSVHLVLHDSSLNLVGFWISQNPDLVRSVTLVDTGVKPAMPLWLMEVPAASILSMASTVVYKGLINFCCSTGIAYSDLIGHRKMYRTGMVAMREMNGKLNASFDMAEWGKSEGMKGMPLQVIWASNWSSRWKSEGDKVSKALNLTKFVSHSGGRWPNGDSSRQIADQVAEFIGSLPQSDKRVQDNQAAEHIQQVISEAQVSENDWDN